MLSGIASRRGAPALALAAGALAVPAHSLAHPATSVIALLSLALLFALWAVCESPRRAAWLGWCWGLGLFGAGVSWVWVSLHVFGGMPSAVAALATAAFCAYLALFPALAGSLSVRTGGPALASILLLMPALWTLGEWLRGWLLTGFPWLSSGYAHIETPFAGFAPIAGVHGVGLAAALCAGSLAAALTTVDARRRALSLGLGTMLVAAGAMLGAVQWTWPSGSPVTVALVQGNVPQSMKFDPQRYGQTLATYGRMVESSTARLVILPETAIPRFLDAVDPAYLDALASRLRATGGDLLLGAPFRDSTGRYYNGVVNLGASPTRFYAKRHLVPFGEFVPHEFRWFVSMMQIPLSDFSPGGRQAPVPVAGELIGLSVCYEDAFGNELIEQLPQATLLVNVSNVAWFGDSLAPDQHLQISRMRALESGRWMLRSTNTGATAAIDHRGALASRLAPFTEGVLYASAQPRSGATPYVRTGDLPVIVLAALMALAAVALALGGRARQSG